jgi:hypothetical protein
VDQADRGNGLRTCARPSVAKQNPAEGDDTNDDKDDRNDGNDRHHWYYSNYRNNPNHHSDYYPNHHPDYHADHHAPSASLMARLNSEGGALFLVVCRW